MSDRLDACGHRRFSGAAHAATGLGDVPRAGAAQQLAPARPAPAALILMGDWCGSVIRHRKSENRGAR